MSAMDQQRVARPMISVMASSLDQQRGKQDL